MSNIIYQITNRVNGRTYVGKTTKTIEERFKRHEYNSSYGIRTYLYNAIRKYGIDNFSIEALEETNANIDEREKYWIAKLNPHYNMTKGGDGGDTSNSPNWKPGYNKHDTYGMLGKKHPGKGKPLKVNYKPVSCDGLEFESIKAAIAHFPGISVYKRLNSSKYPTWYRL
jgi:hypothetical protein